MNSGTNEWIPNGPGVGSGGPVPVIGQKVQPGAALHFLRPRLSGP